MEAKIRNYCQQNKVVCFFPLGERDLREMYCKTHIIYSTYGCENIASVVVKGNIRKRVQVFFPLNRLLPQPGSEVSAVRALPCSLHCLGAHISVTLGTALPLCPLCVSME